MGARGGTSSGHSAGESNKSEYFDELFGFDGEVRPPYQRYMEWFAAEDKNLLGKKSREAEAVFRSAGITFNVYGDDAAHERLIPFDFIPRIIAANEWAHLRVGIEQRVRALNDFMHDLYNDQEIIGAGILPQHLVVGNEALCAQMMGFTPPGGVYAHIVGVDLVRTDEGQFYVLEDNARTPSGVSYMLENRTTMLRLFPELFGEIGIQPVRGYPAALHQSLSACAPPACDGDPVVAMLTPGIYNSAYFEHAALAEQMGVELVEGHDLQVVDGRIGMRTTQGFRVIDVLYRRIDDDFLDPLTFNSNSMLGVPGIMDVYRTGGITIANAPGTGIADDKAIYSYMPEIVEFYTGSPAQLENVPTWRCSDADSLDHVLQHLDELVVKEVHGSGGYGMLVGPTASRREIAQFKKVLQSKPANYIAQPTLSLSTVPIFHRKSLTSRHVDLRPFVLLSPDGVQITPGGLTRVALKKGSLVVNSSQGGGTKDTWVLADDQC